jgi:hypothetical protein
MIRSISTLSYNYRMRRVGKAKVSLELVDTAPLAGRHMHVPIVRVDVGAGKGSSPLALHSPRHTYTHTPSHEQSLSHHTLNVDR